MWHVTSRSNLGYSSADTAEVVGTGASQGGTAEGVGTGTPQGDTADGVGSMELPTPQGTPSNCPTLFDSWPTVSDAVTFTKESGDIGFAGFIKASIGSGSDVAVLWRMGMVVTEEAFPAAMLGLEPVLGIRDILMRIRIPDPPIRTSD